MKKLICLLIVFAFLFAAAAGETLELQKFIPEETELLPDTPVGYWTVASCDSVDVDTGEHFLDEEYPEVRLMFDENGTGHAILSPLVTEEELHSLEWKQEVEGYSVTIHYAWGDSNYTMKLDGSWLYLVSDYYETPELHLENTLTFLRDAGDPVAKVWHLDSVSRDGETYGYDLLYTQGLATDLELHEDGTGWLYHIVPEVSEREEVTWEIVERGTRYRFINCYTGEEVYLTFEQGYDHLIYDCDNESVRYVYIDGYSPAMEFSDAVPFGDCYPPELGN